MLHDNGSLVSVAPTESRVTAASTGGEVLAICRSHKRLLALVDHGDTWTLKQFASADWVDRASIPSEGEELIAMDCEDEQNVATLVTGFRLIQIEGDDVHVTYLSRSIHPPRVTATALTTEDFVWLGMNNGEWGGGLRRISRLDGEVDTIELNRSGELCGGPLNADCDPVNGLAISPWRPDCVVAAIGLVHFRAHGRIVEICDSKINRLYFKPLDPQPPGNRLDDGEPSSTIAFFSMAQLDNGLLAIGLDGIYGFYEPNEAGFQALPGFQNISGYRVSFAIPKVVLVLTTVNSRASVSGAVPLIAVR